MNLHIFLCSYRRYVDVGTLDQITSIYPDWIILVQPHHHEVIKGFCLLTPVPNEFVFSDIKYGKPIPYSRYILIDTDIEHIELVGDYPAVFSNVPQT